MFHSRYGIDAPGLVRGFLLIGICFGSAAYGLLRWSGAKPWSPWIVVPLLLIAVYSVGMFLYMLWGSLITKVRGRDAILDLIRWTGQEHVLDVGCGRGLLLVGAAQRLTTGHATGIDLWLKRDQSSNHKDAPLQNATAEGVRDRVSVQTGDVRELPFADGSFDVVLSHWVVHNLSDEASRTRALAEMVRVLRSPGTILLTDIACCAEYERVLRSIDLNDVQLIHESKWRAVMNRLVSFGAFQPATIVAYKA